MTEFEKIVIGLAYRLIEARDCKHMSEYPSSVACSQCMDRERAATTALTEAVCQEGDRRFLLEMRSQGRLRCQQKQEGA
jgi:hypothetical protein